MTNLDRNIKSLSGWKIYRKRWIIETVFRDLKSNLHLEECSSRSLKAQINHIKACMGQSARQDYLKIYHSENTNIIKDLSYAA